MTLLTSHELYIKLANKSKLVYKGRVKQPVIPEFLRIPALARMASAIQWCWPFKQKRFQMQFVRDARCWWVPWGDSYLCSTFTG